MIQLSGVKSTSVAGFSVTVGELLKLDAQYAQSEWLMPPVSVKNTVGFLFLHFSQSIFLTFPLIFYCFACTKYILQHTL